MIFEDLFAHRSFDENSRRVLNKLLSTSNYEENKTVYWRGSDSQDMFIERIGSPTRPFIKEQFNYWKDKKIEYRYNEKGFRSDDSFEGKGILCLGCSYTEGIGLPIEYNWSYKLAKALNTKHFNLGQAGLGLDSAYRLLLGYKDKLKFDKVFLLAPPPYRYEWFTEDNGLIDDYFVNKPDLMQWLAQSMGSNFHIKEPQGKFFKSFIFGSEMNDTIHESKVIHAIKGLCSEIGVDFYYRSYYINRKEKESLVGKDNVPARDGHPGSAEQEFYFNSFLKMINENN